MRTWMKVAVGLLAIALVACGIVWASGEAKRKVLTAVRGVDCQSFEFSASKWHSQHGAQRFSSGPRTHQAVGLSECDLLLAETKVAVRRMLGPPQPDFGSPRYRSYRQSGTVNNRLTVEWKYREWDYIVGGDGDHLILAVKFNRSGRVKSAYIY